MLDMELLKKDYDSDLTKDFEFYNIKIAQTAHKWNE